WGVNVDRRADRSPAISVRCPCLVSLTGETKGIAAEQDVRWQRLCAGQFQDDLRDLGRIAPFVAPIRLHLPHAGADGWFVLGQQLLPRSMRALTPVGPHRARLQCRQLHAEGRSLECNTFGESAYAPLGREVGGVARKGGASTEGRDLDDVPATL